MNNYEYIIASLPAIGRNPSDCGISDANATLDEIRSLLSDRDSKILSLLLEGFGEKGPDEDFYRRALGCRNDFIRSYFRFDLQVRNVRAEFLAKELGYPEGKDIISLNPDEEDFDRKAEILSILSREDILKRERDLDDLMWDEADRICETHVLDLDIILGFCVKLLLVARWLALDPESGRRMFIQLVEDIKKVTI